MVHLLVEIFDKVSSTEWREIFVTSFFLSKTIVRELIQTNLCFDKGLYLIDLIITELIKLNSFILDFMLLFFFCLCLVFCL